ncbi:hypothetical protein V8F33_011938 [Rhypophila sp. PSN 637]
MAILLTGGTSAQTSVEIAKKCTSSSIPFILASRRGNDGDGDGDKSLPSVKFDWTDPSTYPNPFSYNPDEKITAVYMVIPTVPDAEKHMKAFIDYAISQGVKRFVMMAGTTITLGGPGRGKVWSYLVEKGVEYAICRPTWFQENFVNWGDKLTIKNQGKIYGCVGDAKIPFVSSVDVAHVAFVLLTQEKAPNADYRIVGPELLTYKEVAAKFTAVLGKTVEYVNLTSEERHAGMVQAGIPADTAAFLVWLEEQTAKGCETHMNDVVETLTGQKPRSLDSFIEENKDVWA